MKQETFTDIEYSFRKKKTKIASASWTPSGRNLTILAMVLGGSSDSPKTGAAAADQAA